MDEPVKMLSRQYTERMGDLLLTLAEEMGIQIVMVTHNEDLQIGKVVRL